MEYKNKYNNSTAPQASSPMENKNKSPSPLKIEAFKQAISEFYAQGRTSLSLELLYRDGYHMILYKKGKELYSAVEITMTSEVQSLCRPLEDDAAPAEGAEFLKEMLAKWNQHIEAVKNTGDMLMYMDRTFVQTNRKTPIYELGLRLWLDHTTGSDKIRERLMEAMKAVKQQGCNDKLVAGVNKMLTELGTVALSLF